MQLLSAALCLAFQGQATSPIPSMKVSVVRRASRATDLMKELSEKTKLRFETTPQTENEILVVSAKDVELSDLMDQVAIVTSGDWKPIEGGYRLAANTIMRQRESNSEAVARVKLFQASIQKKLDAIKKQEEDLKKMMANNAKEGPAKQGSAKQGSVATEPEEFAGMMGGQSADTTITRLLQNVNASLLANIESGDRVVFSTNPKTSQYTLISKAL